MAGASETPASPLDAIETRRVVVFLVVAFGVSWAVGGYIALTGGLESDAVLLSGTPVTRTLVLLAVGYMWGPAVGNVVARLATGEGRANLYLQPRIRRGWPYWLAAWLLPVALTLVGAAVYFGVLGEFSLVAVEGLYAQFVDATGVQLPGGATGFVALQVGQAILLAPLINSLFAFGEEFGWRGYLLPKLLPLGERRAALAVGVVWGVWHWPIIAMRYNYGSNYPGAPWLGLLAMVWFSVATGVFLDWVTLRGASVWPAAIGHAAINGIAGLGLFFVEGNPLLVLGPAPTGVVASIAWTLLAVWIVLDPERLRSRLDSTT
ncbi:MAG TPA: CPBP family intramembrane glutamic endopeptidase [Halobacteriales archaeon]|nr:CPBP family intramembrane glutamic endopeptidase [Halobacteriales archaeon]